MTDLKPLRWPRRLLKLFLWTAGSLVLLWTVTFALATWELNRVVAELKKRGEPTTFAEAVAGNLEGIQTPNGSEQLREAIREDQRIGQPGYAILSLPRDYDDPAVVAQHRDMISQADGVVALLEEAVSLPPGPFKRPAQSDDLENQLKSYEEGELRSFTSLLADDVRVSAATGDARRAWRQLSLNLRLSEQLAAERFLLAQFIRINILSMAHHSALFALPKIDITHGEFSNLDSWLVRIDKNLKLFPSLVNQRAMQATVLGVPAVILEELQNHAEGRRRTSMTTKGNALHFLECRWAELISSPIGLPVRRRAAAKVLSVPDETLRLVDKPPPWPPHLRADSEKWRAELRIDRLSLDPGVGDYRDLQDVSTRFLHGHRRLTILRIALRMKLYFQRHGKLPVRLDVLCDSTMPELPTKWHEGQPFEYSQKGLAFRIESSPTLSVDPPARDDHHRTAFGHLIALDFTPPKKSKP
jgi:hypothetical protein